MDGNGQAAAQHDVPETPGQLPARGRAGTRRGFRAVAMLIGALGLIAALATPLAPVVANDVEVRWPEAGQLPESTLAFFVPYAPTESHVRVPATVVRNGEQRAVPTTLVSTQLPGAATEGFSVTTGEGQVLVLVGGAELLRAPITPDSDVAIDADSSGSTVRIGDRSVTVPDRRVEEIAAFATDLAPVEAGGMRVSAQTANWFENTPTAGKTALMTVQLLLSGFALLLLVRADRAHGARPVLAKLRYRFPGRVGRRLVDLGMYGVLGGWLVLGPVTPDDSFASMTVRNGLRIGDIGNYYRWENASESPFTLVQRLLEPVAEVSVSPLALRIPSVIAAVVTWLLLTRVVLAVVLPRHGARIPVRVLAAVSLLGWWLPFGLGVRPETFAALGLTAVLAFLLLAVHTERLGWLGLAAISAGLCVAVNTMGVCAVAPVIVLAPRLVRLVSDRVGHGPGPPRSGRLGTPASLLLLACLCGTGLVAMFADQSLFGVRRATEVHRYYGPDVPWFQEIVRYEYLLGFGLEGDVARRAPVLLTIVVLLFCAFLLSRGARGLTGMRLTHVPPACLAISLLLLSLTPSKWTHYFGALAGFGAATLTVGVVLILAVARQWANYRTVLLHGLLGTVLSIITAALVFAGKNNWFHYSHFGVPWGDGPVRPLNSPITWLLLVGVVLAIRTLVTAARRGDSDYSVHRSIVSMPAVVCVLAVGVTVAIALGSFVVAPIRQAGSYSVGGQNLASVFGSSCGIADHLVVTPEIPGGALRPVSGAERLDGFTTTGFPQPAPAAEHVWGSLDGGPLATGSLTSEWFELPELPPDQELAVSVAGRTGDGNSVALEFGHSDAESVRPVGRQFLDDSHTDPDEFPIYPTDHVMEDEPQDNPSWRALAVSAEDVPAGADRVRVRASDGTADPGGWTAVTGPLLREVIPMTEYLRDAGPVLVDWSTTWSFPCVHDFPHVGGGLVEPPRTLITPPSSFGFGGEAAFNRDIGGSFAGVSETGETREIPTRLLGVEDTPQYREWGHLMVVDYPLPNDRYDVHSVSTTRWGWRGEQ